MENLDWNPEIVTTEDPKIWLLQALYEKQPNPVQVVADKLSITRQAAHRQMAKLVKDGLVQATGHTRARVYTLTTVANKQKIYSRSNGLDEDLAWREVCQPLLQNLEKNNNEIYQICFYGFTEMFNNAIDHSGASAVTAEIILTGAYIELQINDDGVGIFKKIKEAFNLEDERHAIFELSKGKLTTDPDNHSGQGIFFTSRAFDYFDIFSRGLFFACHNTQDLLVGEIEDMEGTLVTMKVGLFSNRNLGEIFARFEGEEGEDGLRGFDRTQVPVSLAAAGEDNFVSRSQAKRVLARAHQFKEIILDFEGVDYVGQAFADEIFRVYTANNPDVHITYIQANSEVKKMINWALHTARERKRDQKQEP
ncbi:STAS-like domain-containing protein [Gloeobacter morelensis]|uniref:DUF4325 domain-containing protein n=1 Tax=Gloeobacter morelensis MG652769 TaxID=2781736 RepID=A0ABY3PPG6_9CYAN|nr:DUF4325 domain-containing protein [Gloeobacter morelensis]UFP95547.1 DUF4325 domain-containing protein [Gloeobacter morelensis MG652769]